MAGESGAVICIESMRDKILRCFNRENRRYHFNETKEAMRYVEEGQSKGKVVIRVQESDKS